MTEHQSSQHVGKDGPLGFGGASQEPDRLLVIDDDTSICTLIEKLSEKVGFVPTRAASLEEAMHLLRTLHFECITLDLGLGKNSGVEVLKVLAEMRYTSPIIIISGSKRSMRDFAASIGNMMHLSLQPPFAKPVDFAKLKATLAGIKEKLEERRQTKPAA